MLTPEDFLASRGFTTAAETDRSALISAFMSEMEKGLRGEKSSLMMIPAFVGVGGRIPAGATAAVLDAGGTNFRGGIVSIPPAVSEKRNQPMPGTDSEVGEEDFYAAFAGEVKRLLPKASVKKIGWCFSYPAEATPSLDAKLVRWTKNIKAPAIVGEYVGEELLKRLGGGEIAVVNDTVATLLAAKASEGDKRYSSYIGFILGTGTNAAYVEKIANIPKLRGAKEEDGPDSMIINAESGGFDKIATSDFDKAADAKTGNPGLNIFEKLIAGAYLGQIGLETFKAAAKTGLFSAAASRQISGMGSLETMDLDNFCASFVKPGRENPLDAAFKDQADAQVAKRLAIPVFERAAVLTAVHLAAFVIKSGGGTDSSEPVAINADGSTYYKTRCIPFSETVERELRSMLAPRNIHFEIVPRIDDAPMVGAGIAAMLRR
ncbi:MAG: hexokinase [Kiritimatiellae bacterium]|nr:hexokinase [Kiritimatiellia bacterium]